MRRNITGILALAGALLLVTTWAVAEYSLRPPLTHRHDDGVISLGNTQATPDVAIQWETADASDHHLAIDALSTSDLVVSWDQGTDWGVTNANRLRVQSADEASPTEWTGVSHDGTRGIVATGAANLALNPQTAQVDACVGETVCQFKMFDGGAAVSFRLRSEGVTEQMIFAVDDVVGNQLWLTNEDNSGLDHGVDRQPHPTLFIQSDRNPTTTGANEYGMIWQNQADFVFDVGEGGIRRLPGTKSDGEVTYQAEVQSISTGPDTCETITLEDENTYDITARIVGVKSDGTDRASYHIQATYYRTAAGGATQEGATTSIHAVESDATWGGATFGTSSDDLLVQVDGKITTTIEWVCLTSVVNISN